MSLQLSFPRLGKGLLVGLLLALLVLPAVQARLGLVEVTPFAGNNAPPPPRPELSWAGLLDNSFQQGMEQYIDSRLGFREWFIRLRNQLTYSLFGESKASGIWVGRNGVLFEPPPVQAYVGEDAVSDAEVQRHVRRFRVVQDSLARRGKLLVYVAAPSKASFMPENLPLGYRNQPRRRSNYEAYAAAMRAAGINLLDLSQAFRQWKDTAAYPLFPTGGTHWSGYGAKLAADTLLRYVERRSGRPLRDYTLVGGPATDEPQDNEQDIEYSLNLMFPPSPPLTRHPRLEFKPEQPGQARPKMLLIGDSYCWSILYVALAQAFDHVESRFWFWNVVNRTAVWPDNRPEGDNLSGPDRKKAYLARDVVLILFTEYNLRNNLDYGFSDDAYDLFVPRGPTDSVRIRQYEAQIRQCPGMDKMMWRKSAESGLTYEQLIHQAAVARNDSFR